MLSIKTGVISKEKLVTNSHEIAGEFHWLPALIENLLSRLVFLLGTLRNYVGYRNGR